MTDKQAKKIFDQYNSQNDVVRCPNGRAKMRKPLNAYAEAAVNLYGIIRRSELAEIFNGQNIDQTTADEIRIILLPNVLKFGAYGFYKDYVVHNVILRDFDWVKYLEGQQADKPRYTPVKEEFLRFAQEDCADNKHWSNVKTFMLETFGYKADVLRGFAEIRNYILNSNGIGELGSILEKYSLVFQSEARAKKFFDLLMTAKNNTRIWENKGHTPNEMGKIFAKKRSKEPIIHKPKKVGPNQPCPCGSGKKYKKCCARIEQSGAAQLTQSERKLFYELWYKLLDFANQKLKIVDDPIALTYPSYHDETQLHRIREKLWATPKLIGEFLSSADSLTDEEAALLQTWEKRFVKGQFALVKYEPSHAILMRMDENKPCKLYAVKGMTTSIAEAMHRRLPVMLETVLLPFGDKIIYDSFMASHAIEFGSGIGNIFEEEYTKAMGKYGVALKL